MHYYLRIIYAYFFLQHVYRSLDVIFEIEQEDGGEKGRIDESVLSESKADLMEKLRLTNAGYYTNAAMLLFSKDPDKWQLDAYTKIGFFENDADLRYQDEIHGSILKQIDKIIEVLHLKFVKAKISYEGIQRIENVQTRITAIL